MSDGLNTEPLLRVKDLTVEFATERGWIPTVEDVSFDIYPGEAVGLIGESGSGKTVTSQAIMGLISSPGGRVTSGSVLFQGRELLGLSQRELRDVRAAGIAMIFQEPMSCLDPAFTIGQQIGLVLRRQRGLTKSAARAEAIELLDRVGIAAAHQRVDDYPHRLSGGMRQRALIAQALSCRPALLIADEPTTALDVTVQAQVLELLSGLQDDFEMAVMFVTHDLGVVAEFCERVVVMYAGQVVETGDVSLIEHPKHPYTSALLGCLPEVRGARPLLPIPGTVPAMHALPPGCRFGPRCGHSIPECSATPIPLELHAGHGTRCVRTGTIDLGSEPT